MYATEVGEHSSSMMSGSRRGPMRLKQATTFDNCRNRLRNVLQPILGLHAGKYLVESSTHCYLEVVRRGARPT